MRQKLPFLEAKAAAAKVDPKKQEANPKIGLLLETNGRGGGIRTRDPLHPMQLLEEQNQVLSDVIGCKNHYNT